MASMSGSSMAAISELRNVGQRGLERGRAGLDAARLEAAGEAGFEHALGALAISVCDDAPS